MEGTRVDIDKIMAWVKESDPAKAPSVYWLTGLAGLGKTTIAYMLRFFLFCFVYLCLFIIFRSESWHCHFDSCYDFKRLRQSSTVVGSKVQVLMSLEECKS